MATTITVVCPNCNNRMRASSEFIGQQGKCPVCKSLVDIRGTGDEILPATGATAPPVIKFTGTDIAGWKAGLIGALATVLLYGLVFFPLRNTWLGQMFVNRGSVMYFETLFFCWGFAILVLKYLAVQRQLSYAELELNFIPLQVGLQIAPSNVENFLSHLGRLPVEQRYSILGRRITGALEHFRSRSNASEVQTNLATQAEIDASAVDAGYTLVKAFIWAIPILGFIGTVLGLSQAVSGLEAVSGGGDLAGALKGAMGQVTKGLATAFDTTLVALIMAVVMLFPMESLRRIEYKMLDRIEQFTHESLLRRLSDSQGDLDVERMPQVVREALVAAFNQHQKWLVQWQTQVSQLGQVIGGDFEGAVARVQDRFVQQEQERQQQWRHLSQVIEDLFQKSGAFTASIQHQEQQLGQGMQALSSAAAKLEQAISHAAQQPAYAAAAGPNGKEDALLAQLQSLEGQIGRLAEALQRAPSEAPAPLVLSPAGPMGKELEIPEKKKAFSFWR